MRKLLALSLLCLAFRLLGQNAQSAKPFSIGETFKLDSKALGESRTINVYLPEGYHANDAGQYPVIYLLDGSADEDFIHVAGLVQFCNFSWINILPPSIVVGIANVDRKRDFTFPTTIEADKKQFPTTGGSASFIAFIETELQPAIEANYRSNGEKTIIGQSLGGLLATEVLFKKPHLFDNYLIISPSLWWDQESLLKTDLRHLATHKKKVHITVGKEGKIMVRDAKRLAKQLKALNNNQLALGFNYLGEEDHASIMHLALYEAFKWLGNKK
jgi:predicted alpha/beta superfamily hydrolase